MYTDTIDAPTRRRLLAALQAAMVIPISEGSRDIRRIRAKRLTNSARLQASDQGEQVERATGIEPA